ncbi:D-TA family PLP-dependent enzyme [Sphingobacterium oryzagri]|uniref:D-TA family PLP-dependent enzyme n=1 Tax=Sphingobacterium oryzagri TaxID=3025669 RepID=A0ABY7WFW5_9SPHI|nr:D-TA family PLP-dependent enzyme [Sphingobacterium sp. KACC 22765]WDF67421.1 D-TA family PLP-dependent enzyme [Sphingobacterium sp. KACC 22765]
MKSSEAWYTVVSEQAIDSPALLVFPLRIRQNIQLAIQMVGDVDRLRPHVKTHKSKTLTRLQQAAGIHKFKCATIAEAAMLGECNAADVLLAYPLQGPKISRFIELIARFPETRFSTLIDAAASATELARAALQAAISIEIFVDLDLGMGRTGIKPGDEALALVHSVSNLEGLSFRGFHGYDGHVRDADLITRKDRCDAAFQPVATMLATLKEQGFAQPTLVMGGSPTFPVYADYPAVECSPGTFVLWDKGYAAAFPEQKFLPAAVLLTRVISIPSKDHICLDLGYKAVASENSLENRFAFLDASGLSPVGQSEEHLVVRHPENLSYKVGDVLYALPVHVCPTVALYDKLYAIEDAVHTATWQVDARGR